MPSLSVAIFLVPPHAIPCQSETEATLLTKLEAWVVMGGGGGGGVGGGLVIATSNSKRPTAITAKIAAFRFDLLCF